MSETQMPLAIDSLRKLDARLKQAEQMEKLLKALRSWDHMETAGDGPYWISEIDDVLGSRR